MAPPEHRCPRCGAPTGDSPDRCPACGAGLPPVAEAIPVVRPLARAVRVERPVEEPEAVLLSEPELPTAKPVRRPRPERGEAPRPRPILACGVVVGLLLATALALVVVLYAVAVGLRAARNADGPPAVPVRAR